ncbi:MAG: hypothetical protein NZ908_00945 [Candidatus Micrarchaeota archaeon]|nr:hypothetical protein [Candidatus Micrarchaeota archaeon]MCX8154289.1 hypothetical protein [Candidatus Micrarchaeota archaeon]
MKDYVLITFIALSLLSSLILYITGSEHIVISLFFLFLSILVLSSNTFIETASKIGRSLGLSDYLIGVILIGFGTSTPELVTSIYASFSGNFDISYFNLVGSNIANILLIFGLGMVFVGGGKIVVKTNLLKTESLYLFISAAIPIILFLKAPVNPAAGLFPIAMFIVYFYINYRNQIHNAKDTGTVSVVDYLLVVISLLVLAVSADYTIKYLKASAEVLNIGLDLISLIALAVGTSLPELITTIIIAKRGEGQDMMIGNIIGSNIFNTLMILGLSMIAYDIGNPNYISINSSATEISWLFLILSTVILILLYLDREVYREDGVILVLMYMIFLALVT